MPAKNIAGIFLSRFFQAKEGQFANRPFLILMSQEKYL